jgi:hypothetical protein
MLRALALTLTLLLALLGLQRQAIAMQAPAAAHASHTHHRNAAPAIQPATSHACCSNGVAAAQHQDGCASCGVCHTVLQGAASQAAAPAPRRAALRPARATRFASAPLTQPVKPPIS